MGVIKMVLIASLESSLFCLIVCFFYFQIVSMFIGLFGKPSQTKLKYQQAVENGNMVLAKCIWSCKKIEPIEGEGFQKEARHYLTQYSYKDKNGEIRYYGSKDMNDEQACIYDREPPGQLTLYYNQDNPDKLLIYTPDEIKKIPFLWLHIIVMLGITYFVFLTMMNYFGVSDVSNLNMILSLIGIQIVFNIWLRRRSK